MLKTLFSCLLVLAFSGSLLAQTSDDLKKKQAEIQQEIDDLKQSLNDTKKNKKAGLGQLSMIKKKLRLREQAINNINDQINVIQGNISQSRNEISRLKLELDTLKAQYEKSVVYAYKNRSNYDFLNFIFSAANFNDALKRIEYLKSYRQYREQQATSIKSTQLLLQGKISSLESTQKRKSDALQEQEKEKVVLVEERKEKDEIVNKLKARERELTKELTDKQRADKKLRDGIMAAIRRETEKARAEALRREKEAAAAAKKAAANNAASNPNTAANAPAKTTAAKPKSVFAATPEGELISDNFEKNRGKLPWPIDKGQIKIHFGPYKIPELKITGNNPGLTLETDEGAAVKAVFDGEVISVFEVDGTSAVFVRHGKYFTTYSNLNGVSVSRNQHVKAGQVLGKAASNGEGNGEIEFVLMQDTRNLDPEPWIRRR
ncbi:peptidoglycan DD-metalloendopeptidase family protein [Pseudoflavitalea sp. X16]|uniref:murein hydrolase activator EnvC family protein n=1 Tax=Paraflavitalea devenefica TaxID=2716334 RepID=UPI00141FCAC3|nr:peptidoglycan DD-metalloendopeptidase family protein [Paraflavitalea devenefica]NII25061.1 peptidoglycan DD-metalloendopeptidase family protein [Paraflavitalea devenefica]